MKYASFLNIVCKLSAFLICLRCMMSIEPPCYFLFFLQNALSLIIIKIVFNLTFLRTYSRLKLILNMAKIFIIWFIFINSYIIFYFLFSWQYLITILCFYSLNLSHLFNFCTLLSRFTKLIN